MWPFRKKKQQIKVGDIIKCIDDREWNDPNQNMTLIYGNKYKVLAVIKCSVCGAIAYDIGCRFNNNRFYTKCTKSKEIHDLPCMGTHLAGAFRFEKSVETKEELEAKIEAAVKEEKYEIAQEYKNKLEKLKS